MLLALSVTVGAVIFAAFLFVGIFRFIDPAIVRDDYRTCAGDWYEAELQNCQAGLQRVPQQPVNTYTNLAYLAAGLFPGILLDTAASYVFAFAMVYLCIGSTLYHATSTRWAGMLDVTAIYAVFSALAVYVVTALIGVPEWMTPALMFVVAGWVAYVLTPRYHRNMHLIIGLFLGAVYALVLLRMLLSGLWARWPFLVASLLAFAFAYLFWRMDRARTFPLPRWGHGLWHILTAGAGGLVFYVIHSVSL